MKRLKLKTKRNLMIIITALTIVNVFSIGFSSYIYKGESSELIGNINVNLGGQIKANFKSNPVSSPNITQHGFIKDGGAATYSASLDLLFDLDITLLAGSPKPNLSFSIAQIDNQNEPAYKEFNLLKYLDSISLNTKTNGISQTEVSRKPTVIVGDKKCYANFSIGDKCFAPGYNKFVADSVLSFNFVYPTDNISDSDFASDVFAPIKYGTPTFDLEIRNA